MGCLDNECESYDLIEVREALMSRHGTSELDVSSLALVTVGRPQALRFCPAEVVILFRG